MSGDAQEVPGPGERSRGYKEGERKGHPERHFLVAVSVGAMALAWARQEGAPQGATVVADHEVNALGRIGDPWTVPSSSTLAAAVVIRPSLPASLADAVWLVAGLAAAEGAGAVAGRALGVWWPDLVIDPVTEAVVGKVHAEVQLGPDQVRSAIATVRLDLTDLGEREAVLDGVVGAFDRTAGWLGEGAEGCAEAASTYSRNCSLLGRRLKAVLLPKGETRGIARQVDKAARLELVSATGMVEHIAVDSLRRLEVAGPSAR
jgi:BirA family biotin operon repressor/biotin-[acetyl-CoA-carboxylase] ligase